jgi:hypothetical protein
MVERSREADGPLDPLVGEGSALELMGCPGGSALLTGGFNRQGSHGRRGGHFVCGPVPGPPFAGGPGPDGGPARLGRLRDAVRISS